MNLVVMGIVVLNIVVVVVLYYGLNGWIELFMMVGIFCGVVMNMLGLGVVNEVLSQLNYSGLQIVMGYVCVYLLGVLGIIGFIIVICYICWINLKKEEEDIVKEEVVNFYLIFCMMYLEVYNEVLVGKMLFQVRDFMGCDFVCLCILQNGYVSIFNCDIVFYFGDQLFVVCVEDDVEVIIVFIGFKIEVDWEKQDILMVFCCILII